MSSLQIFEMPPNHYPISSAVTEQSLIPPVPRSASALPIIGTNLVSSRIRDEFVLALPTPVRAKLDQPFGKPNLNQCFLSEPRLRHVLLLLVRSGFLSDLYDWDRLASAYPPTRHLLNLLYEFGDVDFRSLQGFIDGWESEETLNFDRVRLTTAAFLHFNGDAATLVRWIGGPHVAAHRDTPTILAKLEPVVEPEVFQQVSRVYTDGVPQYCNASATEENFQAYLAYGNHASMKKNPEKTLKSLNKDHKRGFALVYDGRCVHFALNCHLTPGGLVDLEHKWKSPRPVFDSSFRPLPGSFAINDWTSKHNEFKIRFAYSFMGHLIWIYNLRITYPKRNINGADDDMTGAFRQDKYNPELVPMHSQLMNGLLVMSTGTTFGDTTSPANFEVVALSRQQMAQHFWKQPDTLEDVARYLPPLKFAPEPTEDELSLFTRADTDELNNGVLNSDGSRQPPPYWHHVDDNLYADVTEFMPQTVAASVRAAYTVLGYPRPEVPNAVSQEKLDTEYGHERYSVGYVTDTRELSVGLSEDKRTRMVSDLADWFPLTKYTLIQASQLHGSLESISRYNQWGRAWFFALQNALRDALKIHYFALKRRLEKMPKAREAALRISLPASLHHRIAPLIQKEKAVLLWRHKASIPISASLRVCIVNLHEYLADFSRPWKQQIGYIIPRIPHMVSKGDASQTAGGAYCERLEFWFDIIWSARTRHCVKFLPPSHPDFVHINALEFVIVILQLAAVTVRLATLPDAVRRRQFPNGVPAEPVLLTRTDNMTSMSWASKVTSKTLRGQQLIGLYAELLREHPIGQQADHIAGVDNIIADDISRPTDPNLTHSQRLAQIYRKQPSLKKLDYFRPSPELLSLLSSLLFASPAPGLPKVPKILGQFEADASTFSCSAEI